MKIIEPTVFHYIEYTTLSHGCVFSTLEYGQNERQKQENRRDQIWWQSCEQDHKYYECQVLHHQMYVN